ATADQPIPNSNLQTPKREQSVMATPVQSPPRPAVIRVSPLEGRSGAAMELLRALPAWVISAGIHALLLFLFWIVVGDVTPIKAKEAVPTETINTRVETPQKDVPLTNVDEGLDPSVPTNYDVPRKSELDV